MPQPSCRARRGRAPPLGLAGGCTVQGGGGGTAPNLRTHLRAAVCERSALRVLPTREAALSSTPTVGKRGQGLAGQQHSHGEDGRPAPRILSSVSFIFGKERPAPLRGARAHKPHRHQEQEERSHSGIIAEGSRRKSLQRHRMPSARHTKMPPLRPQRERRAPVDDSKLCLLRGLSTYSRHSGGTHSVGMPPNRWELGAAADQAGSCMGTAGWSQTTHRNECETALCAEAVWPHSMGQQTDRWMGSKQHKTMPMLPCFS